MGIIHRLSISIGDLFLIDSRDVNLSRVFEAINEIIAAVLSGLPILEIGHQVPHLIRICTKKELSKIFFRFIRNVSRPPNSLVHACLI